MTDAPKEVMGRLCWDFIWPGRLGVHLTGSNEFDTLTQAKAICERMNETYGEGTHWVEPMNTTKEERKDT